MTIAAQITSTGMSVPDYATILAFFQDGLRAIYGSDINLDADTQDGQMVAIFAQAMSDSNQLAQDTYNSFSPSTAQGAGLSSVVKINGLRRNIATPSTATVAVTGTVGTIITNGLIGDNLGLNTKWSLPSTVTIPGGGTINVTATCTEDGATAAGVGTLTRILSPTRGWQSVTNAAAASEGAPVQSDADLRREQASATSISAETPLDAIYSAISSIEGVGRLSIYENDTDSTDGNGVPSHSISPVVQAGASLFVDVATAIVNKKAPGTGTYGTTTETIVDPKGVPNTVHFFVLAEIPITVAITVQSLAGYVSTTTNAIKQSIADFLSGLAIGEDSYLTRLYTAANLNGSSLADTYVVTVLQQSRTGPPAASDVVIAFNEAATCATSDVTVTVL